MKFMFLFLLVIALAGDVVLLYISSLYSPAWFWILAYLTLFGTATFGLFHRKGCKNHWILAFVGSLIINSHYIFSALIVGYLPGIAWGGGLLITQCLLLFLILTLAKKSNTNIKRTVRMAPCLG